VLATAALGLSAADSPGTAQTDGRATARPASGAVEAIPSTAPTDWPDAGDLGQSALRNLPTVGLFALGSMVPAAVLMVTAFVRIQIVLSLVRQALGSPQIPGNQVLAAVSLLLTALVMTPVFDTVYARGIQPYAEGRLGPTQAWEAGTAPLKEFMIDQIVRTGHQDYLWRFHDYAAGGPTGQPDPTSYDQFSLRAVAPAFLLSELTTALFMGFVIYLPFLVVDLVVSAVLAAAGLFLLPPTLVALPLKLVLFVLADGWMLVADMLLRSFEV